MGCIIARDLQRALSGSRDTADTLAVQNLKTLPRQLPPLFALDNKNTGALPVDRYSGIGGQGFVPITIDMQTEAHKTRTSGVAKLGRVLANAASEKENIESTETRNHRADCATQAMYVDLKG